MMKKTKKGIRKPGFSIFGILLLLILFIIVSYITKTNTDLFRDLIGDGFGGIIAFILVFTLLTVIAPISAMPLIPISINLWGPFVSAILATIGWSLGAYIAFTIARKLGAPLIGKFISIDKIKSYEDLIPKKNVFIGLVIMRIFLPVDLLSYALGLFSSITTRSYMTVTIIGVTIFAFAFAYFGQLPISYQIVGGVAAVALIVGGVFFRNGFGIKKT